MSTTNSSIIKDFLRPGLNSVVTYNDNRKPICMQIFKKQNSTQNFEIDAEVAMFGLGRSKAEGSGITYDTMQETFKTIYLNRAYGIGSIITHEAIQDNLYKKMFPTQSEGLRNSMEQLMEVNAASVFNNAFDTNYPIGDALPLISTAHLLGNGSTQSNGVSVAVGLNEVAVQDFSTQIKKMRAASGLFDNIAPRRFIVPEELAYNATRLLQSQYRPATANNDIAVIPGMNLVPEGCISWRYLTNPTAWFIQTDAPVGFQFFDREALNFSTHEDVDTRSIKVTAYQRYSFGVTNPRAIVGTSGVA